MKKKIYCTQYLLKFLTSSSKVFKKCFCCYKSKLFKIQPQLNLSSTTMVKPNINRDKQQLAILGQCEPFIKHNQHPLQIKEIPQLHRLNEIVQERCNKIISDILNYNFEEFENKKECQVQQNDYNQDEYLEKNDEIGPIIINFRKWSYDRFNQANQNLSQNFNKNLEIISTVLEKLNYFICKQFISQNNVDLFVGYFQNSKGILRDYIFKICYSSISQDLLEEIELIKEIDKDQIDQQCHVEISENIHILIMIQKTFLQLQRRSNKFQLLSFRYWSKQFFNTINTDKPFQLNKLETHSQNCQKCIKNVDCNDIRNLRKFYIQQNNILDKLVEKNVFLCEYVNKGGEGVIFEGYIKKQQQYEDFIFKIVFDIKDEEIEQETKIMKLFEMNINVIKFIDFFQIQDNNLKFHVLILEKCKYSLADELLIFQKNQQFTQSQLFKIIFDLLDGLIQLRIYNILHLDIKPANILLSYSGNYVYTDFGMSSIKNSNQQINIKGGTPYYQSPEQEQSDPDIDFKSDVFSLGNTFNRVIQIYEKVQLNDEQIKKFKDIIFQKMSQEQKNSRENCLEIHELFFSNLIKTKNQIIIAQYFNKIHKILQLYSFDKNKDIPYILDLKLYYNLKLLILFDIQANKNNFFKSFIPFCNNQSTSPQITILLNSNTLHRQQKNYLQQLTQLLNNVSECYSTTGQFQKSLQYSIESHKICKQIFKKNHPSIAISLYKFGLCYQNLGDYKKALEYSLEALQMKKQIFKENNPLIAASLQSVGICFQLLGDKKKALEYLLESLQMTKQIFKENHPYIALSLNYVGDCYQDLGDYKKALEYQLESLQMIKQIFKECHPSIAAILNNVGSCYKCLGDYKKALEYLLESLQMIKQIFKECHPSIAEILNNVGLCYKCLGDNKKALEYLLESLQMLQQIFKENHPNIALCLDNVGQCFSNLGDYKKAFEYQLESLQMIKQIFKENHPNIAAFLNNVGLCYLDLGDTKKALEYVLESLQMRKQIFKENHPSIASSLCNVGTCYQKLGDNKKALKYLLESLKMKKQIFKENHPDIATTLNNLGFCYLCLGENKKALEYLLKSIQIGKQIFKENHPSIASSLNTAGFCYRNLGDKKKALEYVLESLEMRKQIFKENNPDIAASLYSVEVFYQNLGDHKKALEYQREYLQMAKQILKKNHLSIAQSLNNVGLCYENLGDHKKALEYQQESLKFDSQCCAKKEFIFF